MENQVLVPGQGLEAWRVENRQQHYGLDAEYLPQVLDGRTLQLTVEALRRTNYTSAVRSSQTAQVDEDSQSTLPGAFYAWYADRGDWELQLFKGECIHPRSDRCFTF